MAMELKIVARIYTGKLAKKYFSMPPLFNHWKRLAFSESSLMKGDKVLVFCGGTGLDFPSDMLRVAEEGIKKKKWENIELIEADVEKFTSNMSEKYGVGVCTLGISVIPDYKMAYSNLLSNDLLAHHFLEGVAVIEYGLKEEKKWHLPKLHH